MFCSVDVETTGTIPGRHEIVQIAIVPYNDRLEQIGTPFYTLVRPEHPERADPEAQKIHNLDLSDAPERSTVIDRLCDWVASLGRPVGTKLVPLSHNWSFEFSFLRAFLGFDLFNEIWHYHPRDAMSFATALNDVYMLKGKPKPFPRVSLDALCKQFGVVNTKPHDALADAIAEAELYKKMLQVLK
jgi:DNA polymerase III epsilon subunit-like protein